MTYTYKQTLWALLPVVGILAGCGETVGDRTVSGAGIGAATGAVSGAALSGNPWAGAAVGGVVGGAVGAAVGSATTKQDVNLGEPVWRK